ncbi:MAG: hypothetical protein OEU48_05890 [Gammaproteobacteria bacterium]|nr:hypothetical protein [Gammaproteobacteria bacterium]
MDKQKNIFFLLCAAFLASACDKQADLPATAALENTTQVSMLSYEEQEAGTDLYPVRVLVSPGFLRLDDGYAESDFVLLDRREKTIFSISHEGQSIMVIENSPNDTVLPTDIDLTVNRTPDKEAPMIAGNQPEHLQYLANGKTCFQSVTVSGVLETAVAAMTEYAELLADRQLNNMQAVPLNMQTPCFLSRYAYAPAWHAVWLAFAGVG